MTSPLQADELVLDEIIAVTERARTKLIELRDEEPEAGTLGLRLSISGSQGIDFVYDLEFVPLATLPLSEQVRNHDGLRVVIPSNDVNKLEGATLDYEHDGLVLRNPNKPEPLKLDNLSTEGELVDGVQTALATEINPALAAHGGFVELVGVNEADGTVYMRMGGGCQGCAMSRMTMMQGVQAMLRESVEGVTRVQDVTDHAAGENPYYS
ncbi:MAG TPA: NifU family protein [Acidimicrobiales bacterium]|nr:NifU family protein [Acidimicrobiales bacterium]